MLFDHCLFFEYFDFINVFVLRRKFIDRKLIHLGNTKANIFQTLALKFSILFLSVFINIEIGWNRTNSDFSIDLQSTVLPLDYYL